MQPPWGGKSAKAGPEPHKLRQPKWQPWSTPPSGPFRVHRWGNIKNHWTGLLGECVMAPSMLPCQWQEECIKELCRNWPNASSELASRADPGWLGTLHKVGGAPMAIPLHELILPQPGLRGWSQPNIQEKTLNRAVGVQSPSPQHPSRHQLPSPIPPQSCPTNKWLSCSLGDLHLHPWPQESQRQVRRGDAPHIQKNRWRNRSGSIWMKIWVMILHCLWTWLPS